MANPMQSQFPPAREPGTSSPLDLPEMEMLLTKVEGKDDKPLKLSKSLSGALDLEQNGHGLPFKVVSEGHLAASLPQSRASSRRASSTATISYAQDQEVPKDYLFLAIASCFCPVWPLNLIPLIFSIMVSAVLCSRAGAGPRGWQACSLGRRQIPCLECRELGVRGVGRDALSQLAYSSPLEKVQGPGDLLFADLLPLCSWESQIHFAHNPAEEGAPWSSTLHCRKTARLGGPACCGVCGGVTLRRHS